MTTEPNLPAGVWRNDEEAAKKWCPWAGSRAINFQTKEGSGCVFRTYDGNNYPDTSCIGRQCQACREYRLTNWERVDEESREITEIDSGACVGYYCGKAGRP